MADVSIEVEMRVRVLLKDVGGDTISDELVKVLSEDAQAEFKSYCNRDDVPYAAIPIISQLAVMRFNQLGAEGMQSQSFSGATFNYSTAYPDNVTHALNRFRQVRFV